MHSDRRSKLSVKEIAVFSMLGALMYASKVLMDLLPNIHLIGTFIIAFTVMYAKKALYPIYIFVFVTGLFSGFATWWVPYLYIWSVLWAWVMLIPEKVPEKAKPVIYMVLCALHGFLYGVLYAPCYALIMGLDFKGMLAWIGTGFYFDLIHGVSNFFCALLVVPIVRVLKIAERQR